MDSLVAARFISYTLLLAVAGLPFYAAIRKRSRFDARARIVLAILALGALVSSIGWAFANVAAMADMPLAALDTETFTMVLRATPLGTVLSVRTALLVLFCLALVLRPSPVLLSALALPGLATAAWAGHAGAGEGTAGLVLRACDVVHLMGASLWLGALLSFVTRLLGRSQTAAALDDLAGFARMGSMVVLALLFTGTLNAWLIADPVNVPPNDLLSAPWLRLIGVKIVLFFAMLGFAAMNRWYLVPAVVTNGPSELKALKTSVILETVCAIAVVAAVSVAGQLPPIGP
ncbi:MAG: copper homeostasis membrane protein CopD [Sphingobium sp.]